MDYLLVNNIKCSLTYGECIECDPPINCYEVENAPKIPWTPFEEPSNIPTEFIFSENNIPKLLIETRGESVSCKLYNSKNELLRDYGDQIYLHRSSCSNNHVSVNKMQYYVGNKVDGIGCESISVVFKYENGFLIPLSCEHELPLTCETEED